VHIRLDPYNPISRETADHSLPYTVATAIIDGFVRTDSFDLERVLDPTRAAFLRDKVKAFPAPELGTIKGGKLKRAQDGYLSRVEIELNDGTVVHGAAKPFPGHPKNPFSDDELRAKIVENAEPIMGKAAVEKLVKYLLAIETAANIKDLTALMAFECKDQSVAAA
jgi:2-methylcitrate dehydratase